MKKSVFQNYRFIIAMAVAVLVAIVFLMVGFLRVGGDEAVIHFTQYPAPIFSSIATVFSIVLFLSTQQGEASRRFWGLFSIGSLFWTIATIIWFVYAVVLQVELPYPSPADFFWVAGYLPLGLSLLARYSSLQTTPGRRQVTILFVVITLLVLFIAFFVLVPVVQEFRWDSLVESLLNLVYPISDAVLLVLALQVLMAYEDSRFIFPWRLIALGLMMNSIGDLLFIFTTSQDLYYPGQAVNTISLLTDFADAVSYVILALGMYAYFLISSEKHTVDVSLPSEETSNSSILIFTDQNDRVISYSENLLALTGNAIAPDIEGSPLFSVLNADEKQVREVMSQLNLIGHVSDTPIEGKDVAGMPKTFWLSALAVRNSDGGYSGANIVLRVILPASESAHPFNTEARYMVEYVLSKTGAQDKMIIQALKTYFTLHIKALYMIVSQTGGASLAANMAKLINAESAKMGRRITVDGLSVSIGDNYDTSELKRDLAASLAVARNYAIDVLGPGSVAAEMELVESQMSRETLTIADRQGLRVV